MAGQLGLVSRNAPTEQIQLVVGDLAAATELAGSMRPQDPADGDEIALWLSSLTRVSKTQVPVNSQLPALPGIRSVAGLGDWQQDLGWSLTQVDSFVSSGAPPSEITVLTGDFDTAAIDTAIGPSVDGIWAQPGEDNAIGPGKSSFDPIGRPVRLAAKEGSLAVSFATPLLQDWLTEPTMAQDQPLMEVAAALDVADVYSATLTRRDFRADPFTMNGSSISTAPSVPGGLVPFDTLGVGLTVRDGAPLGVLVYHHVDEKAAADNAAALPDLLRQQSLISGRPLSELVTLQEVSTSGLLVVATLSFVDDTQPQVIWAMQARQDLPFQHS